MRTIAQQKRVEEAAAKVVTSTSQTVASAAAETDDSADIVGDAAVGVGRVHAHVAGDAAVDAGAAPVHGSRSSAAVDTVVNTAGSAAKAAGARLRVSWASESDDDTDAESDSSSSPIRISQAVQEHSHLPVGGEGTASAAVFSDSDHTENDLCDYESESEDECEAIATHRVDVWLGFKPEVDAATEPADAHVHHTTVEPYESTLHLLSDDKLNAEELQLNHAHEVEMEDLRATRIGAVSSQQRGLRPGTITCHGGAKLLFDFTVDVRGRQNNLPQKVRDGSYDTGCGASCVDEALVKRLLDRGAIDSSAIHVMAHPRILAGFDLTKGGTRISKTVTLSITFTAMESYKPVKLTWIFLVVPCLGAPMLLGGDVISRHNVNQRLSDLQGIINFEFVEGLKPVPAAAVYGVAPNALPIMRVADCGDQAEGWVAVVTRSVDVKGDRPRWVCIRVCHSDGKTPVRSTDAGAHADMLVELRVRHSELRSDRLMVELSPDGAVPVVLQSIGGDVRLRPGAVVGPALRMQTTPADELPYNEDGSPCLERLRKPKAMELFCGAGGLSQGGKPFLDTVLATDVSKSACELYSRNHADVKVIGGDINQRNVQLDLIAEATRLGVEVGSGGPPCTNFSQSGLKVSRKGLECVLSMLKVHAAIPTLRVSVLENVLGFMSTPEWQQTLTSARALGFQFSKHVIRGDDCGLPTKRRRVFIIFTRGRPAGCGLAEEDGADWVGVHTRLESLLAAEKGLEGYSSVATATGISADHVPFYRFCARNVAAPEVLSTRQPCPTLRSSCLRRPFAGTDGGTGVLRHNPRNATEVPTEVAAARHLTWQQLLQVSTFGDYDWPEPEHGVRSDNMQMLANAVPPRMAHYLWEALFRSGALHLAGAQRLRTDGAAGLPSLQQHGEVLDALAARLVPVAVRHAVLQRRTTRGPHWVEAGVDVRRVFRELAVVDAQMAAAYSTAWLVPLHDAMELHLLRRAEGGYGGGSMRELANNPVLQLRWHLWERRQVDILLPPALMGSASGAFELLMQTGMPRRRATHAEHIKDAGAGVSVKLAYLSKCMKSWSKDIAQSGACSAGGLGVSNGDAAGGSGAYSKRATDGSGDQTAGSSGVIGNTAVTGGDVGANEGAGVPGAAAAMGGSGSTGSKRKRTEAEASDSRARLKRQMRSQLAPVLQPEVAQQAAKVMITIAAVVLGVEIDGTVEQSMALLQACAFLGLFDQQPPAEKLEVPLREARSEDPLVEAVLKEAQAVLAPHLLSVNVQIEGWTADQVARLVFELNHFVDDFSKDKWDLGFCKTLPFRIVLRDGAQPVADRPYRYSPQMTALIRVEIDKLITAGIIRLSQSEWSSPVVGVMKPDGTARITVNFRKVNAQSVIPKVPLPLIEDIFNSLGGARLYLGIDISGAFFVSDIDAATIPLTAMATTFGLYEWTRCPQGAAGAPGHFTRLMEIVLQGLERAQSFIDDVIIHSPDVDTHLEDLHKLMMRMRQHGIKLAPGKMHVGCTRIKFLGHIVEVGGIRPDPDKVTALLQMPVPADLSALRSWLGLANYYRRFVRNMAEVISPLTALMAKDVPFVMGEAQLSALEEVSTSLSLHALMTFPDHEAAADGTRPFILATDASKLGFGAVLSQADAAGVEHPIAFASRATLKHQRNWTTTDLEACGVVFGVKKFRHLLWGTPFVIDTDHRALLWLESCKDKTARLARWFEFLNAFPHTIRYKEGVRNGNADGFSRNPIAATAADAAEEAADELLEAYRVVNVAQAAPGSCDRAARLAAAMIADLHTRIYCALEVDGSDQDGDADGDGGATLGDWSWTDSRSTVAGATHVNAMTTRSRGAASGTATAPGSAAHKSHARGNAGNTAAGHGASGGADGTATADDGLARATRARNNAAGIISDVRDSGSTVGNGGAGGSGAIRAPSALVGTGVSTGGARGVSSIVTDTSGGAALVAPQSVTGVAAAPADGLTFGGGGNKLAAAAEAAGSRHGGASGQATAAVVGAEIQQRVWGRSSNSSGVSHGGEVVDGLDDSLLRRLDGVGGLSSNQRGALHGTNGRAVGSSDSGVVAPLLSTTGSAEAATPNNGGGNSLSSNTEPRGLGRTVAGVEVGAARGAEAPSLSSMRQPSKPAEDADGRGSAAVTKVAAAGAAAAHQRASEQTVSTDVSGVLPHTLGAMTVADWLAAQEADSFCVAMMLCLKQSVELPIDKEIEALVKKHKDSCCMEWAGGARLLCRREVGPDGLLGEAVLVIPLALRDKVTHCLHGEIWAGHQGVRRTMELLQRHGWWPGWRASVTHWVEHCWPCQARKGSGKRARLPTIYRELPPHPFHTVATDCFGPLPVSSGGNMYIHVFMCLLTSHVAVYAVREGENTAVTAAEMLVDQYSTLYGMPHTLLSDRGSQYTAEIARAVYALMGVRKLYTTAYHPQANGQAERFMKTLAQMLAMAVDSAHSNWDRLINHVAFAHNSHVNVERGCSPFMLVMGREPRVALHLVLGKVAGVAERSSVSTCAILAEMQERQAVAMAMLHKRAELKRARIMRENAALVRAFNLRDEPERGDMVWVYSAPITHTATTSAEHGAKWRAVLSKKMLDQWQGPYSVLAVGPVHHGDVLVQSNVVLLEMDGGPTRVSMWRTKRCRDPSKVSGRPFGLPDGYARYLLSRNPIAAPAPASVTADEVTWSSDRHGVEAVVGHRVVRDSRGRPGELQYLVRWEGVHVSDTWEPAHLLDDCEGATVEYWNTAAAAGAGVALAHSETSVVQGRLRQARQRANGGGPTVRFIGGKYRLPEGVRRLRQTPNELLLSDSSIMGARVLMRWEYSAAEIPEGQRVQWCEGIVRRGISTLRRGGGLRCRRTKRSTLNIYWFGDTRARETPLITNNYWDSNEFDAPKDAWLLIGSNEQIGAWGGIIAASSCRQ